MSTDAPLPVPAAYRKLIPILNEHLRHSAQKGLSPRRRKAGTAPRIQGVQEKRVYLQFVSEPSRTRPEGRPEFLLHKGTGEVFRSDYNGRPRENWNFGPYREIIARGRTLLPDEEVFGSAARPQKKSARKPQESRKLKLFGGGMLSDRDGTVLRPFLVVEVAPGKRRAFYMSSGRNTPGMSPEGTWVHFGGLAAKGTIAEDGDFVGSSQAGWLIKPREKFGSKKAYADISKRLSREVGSTVPAALQYLRQRFGADFLSVDYDKMGVNETGAKLNAYLAARGAIDAYAGSEEAEALRGMPSKWLREGAKRPEIRGQTVYAAPRLHFNPRGRR